MIYEDYTSKEQVIFDVLSIISPVIHYKREPKKEEIIQFRELAQYSPRDMANAMNVSIVHYYNVENGKSEFSRSFYLSAAAVTMERGSQ